MQGSIPLILCLLNMTHLRWQFFKPAAVDDDEIKKSRRVAGCLEIQDYVWQAVGWQQKSPLWPWNAMREDARCQMPVARCKFWKWPVWPWNAVSLRLAVR